MGFLFNTKPAPETSRSPYPPKPTEPPATPEEKTFHLTCRNPDNGERESFDVTAHYHVAGGTDISFYKLGEGDWYWDKLYSIWKEMRAYPTLVASFTNLVHVWEDDTVVTPGT